MSPINSDEASTRTEAVVPLDAILEHEWIVTHFQPIISVRTKTTIGLEGLSRGSVPGNERLIPPNILFSEARRAGKVLALDRLCRKKTLENFQQSIQSVDASQLVFMNLEPSLLDAGIAGSGHLMDLVSRLQINPANIVIEITESSVEDTKALCRFVETYRYYGFSIALDDVGAGHSNFDRVSLIKPDILKINRSILKDINNNYFNQEVFKSIVNLSHTIGAIVLAEGVETEEEVLQCLALGAELFQGYYFAKPSEAKPAGDNPALTETITHLAEKHRNREIAKIREAKERHRLYDAIMLKIIHRLSAAVPESYEAVLKESIQDFPVVDAAYIVDRSGVQMTDTVLGARPMARRNRLFQPAVKGDDLSMKEYLYPLINAGLKRYTTNRYISLATGSITKTVSCLLHDLHSKAYVLCVDFREDRTF